VQFFTSTADIDRCIETILDPINPFDMPQPEDPGMIDPWNLFYYRKT